jgi:hypothetical protein
MNGRVAAPSASGAWRQARFSKKKPPLKNSPRSYSAMADGGDGTVIPFPQQEPEPIRYEPTLEDEFFNHLGALCRQGLETAKRKNADYAGNGDPFANFRACEQIGVSCARGMLVRMQDKIQRISNLIERPAAVANEPLEDTLMDLGMYAFIMATYFRMHPDDDQS